MFQTPITWIKVYPRSLITAISSFLGFLCGFNSLQKLFQGVDTVDNKSNIPIRVSLRVEEFYSLMPYNQHTVNISHIHSPIFKPKNTTVFNYAKNQPWSKSPKILIKFSSNRVTSANVDLIIRIATIYILPSHYFLHFIYINFTKTVINHTVQFLF